MSHRPPEIIASTARPRWFRTFELAAVSGVAVLLVHVARPVAAALAHGEAPWVLPGVVLGVLLADLASGVVHWGCDTFLAEDTPFLGPLVIAPFREHHRDPRAITTHGFLELNGNTCAALLPLLALTATAGTTGRAALFGRAVVAAFALALVLTNQLHQWAHAPAPARVVRWLQRCHLALTPAVHDRHHSDGFTQAYCITTGWLNGPLDRWRVFPRLTRLVRGVERAAAWSIRSSRPTPLP